jgi:hypothetical protein
MAGKVHGILGPPSGVRAHVRRITEQVGQGHDGVDHLRTGAIHPSAWRFEIRHRPAFPYTRVNR